MVLTPPRPCARIARLRTTTPMAQFDQSFDAQPPSEKQFEYAQNLALQTSTAMPPEAHTDRSVCSTFIDECRAKMPPSAKQLAFAEKLAEGAGVALPPDAAVNMVACSEFIDQQLASQNGGVPGAMGGAMGGAPSEKQLMYAISLAQKAKLGLSAEVLADKRACSAFIDSQVSGGDESAAAAAPPAAASALPDGFWEGDASQDAPPAAPTAPAAPFREEEIPF